MDWTSLRMQQITASETLKMLEIATLLESEGRRVYHFEVGQPDFPTPSHIIEAGIEAMRNGFTRYVSSRGIPGILDAIAEYYQKRGISIDGRSNVVVTPGAKMALFMGFLSTIDPGDDVILLNPAWPSYRVMIQNAGGRVVDVNTSALYQLDTERLKEKITKRTTCVVINSPNNPTGGVMSRDELRAVYDLACDHDFVIFSDEIYEALTYDGVEPVSMLEIDPSLERTLVINGFSKTYSMTGWRLGFAVGNKTTIDNMVRVQQNTTSCATSFVQKAGIAAIRGDNSFINSVRAEYQRRRDRMLELLLSIEGVSCARPKGAFYLFPDFSEFGIRSNELSELLLTETGVVTTAGSAFGSDYDYHLRFSYATSMKEIEDGMSALVSFMNRLRRESVVVSARAASD
ncbi:MAG: pyridoxal phosphate-dependent aminotransferase [Candidatus Thorarchaeota archaeon]